MLILWAVFLPSVYAGHWSVLSGISDSLVRPTVGFAEASTIVPEGFGRLDIGLNIESGGHLSGTVTLKVAAASTAVEGIDFRIVGRSIDLASGNLKASLDILDNGLPGGRYLILEMELPDSSLLAPGKQASHIVLIQDGDVSPPAVPTAPRLKLAHVGSYFLPKGSSAEILAYDAASSHLFVTNFKENRLEILDFSDPSEIKKAKSVPLGVFGGHINAVATHNGIAALAIEGEVSTDPGKVVFVNADGIFISAATVGAMPDMIVFSPDGSSVLTANEGEPSDDYKVDPEGSVSIVDISNGAENPVSRTLGFSAFNHQLEELKANGIRIFGPGATVAQDLEPEYIALSSDGAMAYVTCQENNALAIIDLRIPEITALLPLGYKDWMAEGCTLDVSNQAGGIFFANWPIRGMYQPDAIDYFTARGKAYLITANEGDARDYEGFTEEFRVKDDEIALDDEAFPGAAYLKNDVLLGRLRVSRASGDTDGDGKFEELYTFGGRSFAIWDAETGDLVYDSGGALEQATAADPVFGKIFNSQHKDNDFKARSDDKGPEPAAVKAVEVNDVPFAFIALERIGGVVVYNLSRPASPEFVQYINTRAVDSLGGDLGPEGMIYIEPENSPTGLPYLLTANEVSGSVAVFEVDSPPSVGFAYANSIVEEGAGELEIALAVEKNGKLGGRVQLKVIDPSNAREGEDYELATTSILFDKESGSIQPVKIDIPDNNAPGPRYLILEIDPEASTVNVGEISRHILLIQDNDERARR